MATHGDIGVSQPAASTITMKVRTVTLDLNSTVTHQEVLTIGDGESTLGLARVLATAPPSTTYGLAVRIAGGPSSAVDVQFRPVFSSTNTDNPVRPVFPSTAGDNPITAYQSTAADLQASVQQISTAWAVQARTLSVASSVLHRVQGNSSASDYIPVRIVDSSGTGFLSPGTEYTDGSTYSSFAGTAIAFDNSSNNTMRLAASSTPFPTHLRTSSGTVIGASTSSPSSNAWGLNVRTVSPGRQSVYSTIVSTASSAFYTIVSSAAGLKQVCRGYSVTSTAVAPVLVQFLSSTDTVKWHTEVGSGSSGVTGANFAMPDGIFETAVAAPINVRLGSTGVEVKISLSYHPEA